MKYPLSKPDISSQEKKAVLKVMDSGRLSLGPVTKLFEDEVARLVNRKYAVAVNSGTSALHLIIRALGIGEGDEVITTPLSFIASSNCLLFEGAKPVFVDIDPETACLDAKNIERVLTKKTKAILAVDAYGFPAEYDELKRVARKHGLILIEDSAESLGAYYKGKPCGSFGRASVLAFYANKPLTTAEGGVVLTDDKKIADLARSMSNQGREYKNGEWGNLHVRLGYNYRISELHSALGLVQIRRSKSIFKKRRRVISYYLKYLKDSQVEIPEPYLKESSSIFVFVVLLPKGLSRSRVIRDLSKKGVQSRGYFNPIHLQPFYAFKEGSFPVAEDWGERALSLPFYPSLSESQVKDISNILKKVIQ